jgi:Protein of unknown function (DUF2997)
MARKTIEVVIAPDGSLKIEALGFKGADCEKATAFLEKALGRVSGKSKKPEYYHREELRHQQKVGV